MLSIHCLMLDCALRQWRAEQGLSELTCEQQYELPSEQTAFSAMWTEEISNLNRSHPMSKGEEYLGQIYLLNCSEFNGFYCYLLNELPQNLLAQLKHHFNVIADSTRGTSPLLHL